MGRNKDTEDHIHRWKLIDESPRTFKCNCGKIITPGQNTVPAWMDEMYKWDPQKKKDEDV